MNSQITLGLTLVAVSELEQRLWKDFMLKQNRLHSSSSRTRSQTRNSYVKEFVPVIGKAVQAHGGKFLAAGGKTVSIFGDPPKSLVVLTQFPNLDQAQAFAAAQDTKDAVAIGNKYATLRWFAVEGVSP